MGLGWTVVACASAGLSESGILSAPMEVIPDPMVAIRESGNATLSSKETLETIQRQAVDGSIANISREQTLE